MVSRMRVTIIIGRLFPFGVSSGVDVASQRLPAPALRRQRTTLAAQGTEFGISAALSVCVACTNSGTNATKGNDAVDSDMLDAGAGGPEIFTHDIDTSTTHHRRKPTRCDLGHTPWNTGITLRVSG